MDLSVGFEGLLRQRLKLLLNFAQRSAHLGCGRGEQPFCDLCVNPGPGEWLFLTHLIVKCQWRMAHPTPGLIRAHDGTGEGQECRRAVLPGRVNLVGMRGGVGIRFRFPAKKDNNPIARLDARVLIPPVGGI